MNCPKCRGYVMPNGDRYGRWVECLNCGWSKDDGEPIDFDPQAERRERQLLTQRKHHERMSEAAKLTWIRRRCAGK